MSKQAANVPNPDQRTLSPIQAKRLAGLAGIKPEEIASSTIARASEQLKWKVDPELFLFRRVCGKVVKKDPVTGVEYPVPFATVYVEDTDCNVITYFPKNSPWGWHFPFLCHREVIGTTKTDECGNFCVWVPRFDIDWVLHWRKLKLCFPIIFQRPNLGDLLDRLRGEVVGPWPPIPGPDPGPLGILSRLPISAVRPGAGQLAESLARKVSRLQALHAAGAPESVTADMLSGRGFDTELPPPLPAEINQVLSRQANVVAAPKASAIEGVRSAIALKVGMEPSAKEIAAFNPDRFIGPFRRCIDIYLPEWQLILDVPDITFRVTQDVNGDGTEDNIYSESHFDVRWDAAPLASVTLHASSIAKETHACQTPSIPCSKEPAILFAGLMPLQNAAYFDRTAGYALRPNRPSPSGNTPLATDLTRPAAKTPFCQTLQLYGCVNVDGAHYYRVVRSIDGGAHFSAITGLAWNIYTFPGGTPVTISADSSGWYPVLPNPDSYHPARLVLEWPTPALDKSILKVEIADASKNVIGASATVAIQSDNTAPTVLFERLAWKFVGESDSALRSLLGISCPTIHRGAVAKDIEVVFEVNVSANHLRSAYIQVLDCGGGAFAVGPGAHTSHWHTNTSDNAEVLYGRYTLAASALEGAYLFHGVASSRAMNPAGADGGNMVPPDWYYDPVYIHVTPYIQVAIVNAN
jgi:hypothetical protein